MTVGTRFVARLRRALGPCAAALALCAALPGAGVAAQGATSPPPPFRDLSGVSPLGQRTIIADAKLGLMAGTAAGKFDPQGTVTRAQAVRFLLKVLVVAHDLPAMPSTRAKLPFGDVSPASPYDAALAQALTLGILAAPAAGAPAKFYPTRNVSRADLAQWAIAVSLAQPSASAPNPYRDLGHLSASELGAVLLAAHLGLVPPAGAKAFDPIGSVNRVAMAITLFRLYTYLVATTPSAATLTATQSTFAAGGSEPLTLAVDNAAGGAVAASALAAYKVTYTVTASQGGDATTAGVSGGTFTAATPGDYQVTASIAGGYLTKAVQASLPTLIPVYGPPAQVVVSAPATLTADGQDGATVDLTVEDSGGRTVADFNGSVTVSSSQRGAVGVLDAQGTVATAPLTVLAVDGLAKVSVRAGLSPGAQATITARAASATGTATVATQGQTATRVVIQAATPAMADQKGANDAITAEVVDQAGFPMGTGTYPMVLHLATGGATLASLGLRGGGPIDLTYTGGSARPPTTSLTATGKGGGTVEIDAATSVQGVAPGTLDVSVVGGPPPSTQGSVEGLAIGVVSGSPSTSAAPTVAIGGVTVLSVSYTGQGLSPVPAPGAISVVLSIASGGGSASFTDLPSGATVNQGGTSVNLTIPSGVASVDIGLAGASPGPVTLTAEGSVAGTSTTPAASVSGTLPVTVTGQATNPVTGVVVGVGGVQGTSSGATVPVPSPGAATPVTVTLVGTAGTAVFAPQPEVVILSDSGLAPAPNGGQVAANTMTAGGAFSLDGSAPTQLVVIPAGQSGVVVNYTNQTAGTYQVEAQVIDPGASGLNTSATGTGTSGPTSTYAVDLVAVGVPQGDLLGDFATALNVASNRVTPTPSGEQATAAGGGTYAVSVTWPGGAPPIDSVYAQITAVSPTGAQIVNLGPPPAPVFTDTLTASTQSLSIPSATGSATVTYTVVDQSGNAVPDATVDLALANANGSDLSLSATGSSLTQTLTTGTDGTAVATVYGNTLPDAATLTATLPAEPTLPAVSTAVQVTATGNDTLSALPTELGPTQFTADAGGEPITFTVTLAGVPVQGVTVDFALAVGSSGLGLAKASATTNASGEAVVRVRGYTTSAQGAVVASLPSVSGQVVSTGPISVAAGKPAKLATSLPPGDTLTADAAASGVDLLVVVEDQYGNPVPGPTPLAVTANGPLQAASSVGAIATSQAGSATIPLTDPQGTLGADQITVTDTQDSRVALTLPLTIVAGAPAHFTAGALGATTVKVGNSIGFTLTATDAFGNPVSGTFPVQLGGSAMGPAPDGEMPPGRAVAVTFQNGTATAGVPVTPVLAESGGTLTAQVGTLPAVTLTTDLTVTPGDPAYAVIESIAPSRGSPLSVTPAVGPWGPTALEGLGAPSPDTTYKATIQVVDVVGNPVSQADVQITAAIAPEAGGSATLGSQAMLSDASGQATLSYTTSGAQATKPKTGDVITLTLPYSGNQTVATTGGY